MAIQSKPTFKELERKYHGTGFDPGSRFPCEYVDQCAVRMSVALQHCGYKIEGFHDPKRIHGTPGHRCALKEPHIVGATELMDHIKKDFGLTKVFLLNQVEGAYAALRGKKGIVHFLNLGTGTGDHIDLFDGTAIYNEINGNPDRGHSGFLPKANIDGRVGLTERHYFKRAKRVDFIELQ